MAWKYKSARILRASAGSNTPIVAAAVTIYDDAAQQQPGEPEDVFLARSHRTYQYTRMLTADGSGFAQTLQQFRDMVKAEVKGHIDLRNAAAAQTALWEDATGFEV